MCVLYILNQCYIVLYTPDQSFLRHIVTVAAVRSTIDDYLIRT